VIWSDSHSLILSTNRDADVEIAEQSVLMLLHDEDVAIKCYNGDLYSRLLQVDGEGGATTSGTEKLSEE